jgi:SAM-dependent methyltransferase
MSSPETVDPAALGFDRLSARYEDLCANEIFSWMRRRVHSECVRLFTPAARVLEIGCGVGLDTAFLAAEGFAVTATDPAPGMARRTRERLRSAVPQADVIVLDEGLQTLEARLVQEAGSAPFDAIFSNFGALNCVEDLTPLRRLAEHRLTRGGCLLLCLMSRVCPWEIGYFLAKGRPRTALRRIGRDPIMVDIEGIKVPTFYHRPRRIMNALGTGFSLRRLLGLAVVVPPPYLAGTWSGAPPRLRRSASTLDGLLSGRAPFNRLGDHFLIDIVKR